jgi:hypothetical protein
VLKGYIMCTYRSQSTIPDPDRSGLTQEQQVVAD